MSPPRRGPPTGTLVMAGMLAFAAAFIGLATWLGQQDRASYRNVPEPPLPEAAAAQARALGLRRPIPPRGDVAFDGALAAAAAGETDPKNYAGLEALAARLPDDGEARLLLGIARELTGDRSGARAAFDDAGRLRPEDPDPLLRRARLDLAAGRRHEALEGAEAGVRLAPGWADGWVLLGQCCLAAEDLGRAKRAFNDALLIRPDDPVARAAIRRIEGF